jgi:hypothetical protein
MRVPSVAFDVFTPLMRAVAGSPRLPTTRVSPPVYHRKYDHIVALHTKINPERKFANDCAPGFTMDTGKRRRVGCYPLQRVIDCVGKPPTETRLLLFVPASGRTCFVFGLGPKGD